MEISLAAGDALGEREGIAGLYQHMQTPALDLCSLAGSFDDLGHLWHESLVRARSDEPSTELLGALTDSSTELLERRETLLRMRHRVLDAPRELVQTSLENAPFGLRVGRERLEAAA